MGAILVSNLTANLNGAYGAWLDNTSATITPQPITLSGTNQANANSQEGAVVRSKGVITINNLTARWNGNDGLEASNSGAAVPTPIYLTGINVFVGNGGDGARLQSIGDVIAYRVTADDNASDGLDIVGSAVTIACGSLNGNASYGVAVFSFSGSITLKGVFTAANGTGAESLSHVPTRVRTCP